MMPRTSALSVTIQAVVIFGVRIPAFAARINLVGWDWQDKYSWRT